MILKRLAVILSFLLLAFPASAVAAWTPLNDTTDLNYDEKHIQVFVALSGKKEYLAYGSGFYDPAEKIARQMIYDYVVNLTIGKGDTKLKEDLKDRPAMTTKLLTLIDKNKKKGEEHVLADTLTHSVYYVFDLKLLLTLFPELNLPEK